MMTSELIAALQESLEKDGDLRCYSPGEYGDSDAGHTNYAGTDKAGLILDDEVIEAHGLADDEKVCFVGKI